MNNSFDEIRRRIVEVAPGLHGAGTFPVRTLEALVQAASSRRIRHSVETGCGVSTLVFSHRSDHHTVFALDGGDSLTNVRRSPLLRKDTVTFIEGPSQLTLPQYRFTDKLQLALIDGPHAYPFPDLEYYFLYPHLDTGALLILDDIHIPSVHNLFEFVRKDAMFRLDRVVGSTAFLTRTDAPTFDPFGDGWENQNYNATLRLRYTWRDRVRALFPATVQRSVGRFAVKIRRGHRQWPLEILAPREGIRVAGSGAVEGVANVPADLHLWVLVRRRDVHGWWPQGGGAVPVLDDRWRVNVNYGGPPDAGRDFEIAALIVGAATHEFWTDWVARVQETGLFPPVQLPSAQFRLGQAFRRVTKMQE